MKKVTKIIMLIAFIFSFYSFNLNAQIKKSNVEIKNLTMNPDGKISWEIYYTSRELSYQIEFFEKGAWLVNSTFKQSVSMVMPDQKEEFSTKDSINGSITGRYRLRITEPVNIISEEVHK